MSRLERKGKDILLPSKGGLGDLIDATIMSLWRINDSEYNYICEFANDEELNYFVIDLNTFPLKRQALLVYNKLLNQMYE